MRGQINQAARVNSKQNSNYKNILEVSVICLIHVLGNTNAATDNPSIIVKICQVFKNINQKNGAVHYKYQCCTK